MESRVYYYRSQHPLVAEMYAELERRAQAFHAACDAFEAEFPGHKLLVSKGYRYQQAHSLTTNEPKSLNYLNEHLPGEGWRVAEHWHSFTPRRSTKIGRALAKRLSDISLRWPQVPGSPTSIYLRQMSKTAAPGFSRVGDTFWLAWGCPYEAVEAETEFDSAIWQRALSSEYWLAVEAAGEEHDVI